MVANPLFVEDNDQPANSREIHLPRAGVGLCLSGGGYRAALFHLGTLWRLNEFGYLPRLDRISSVSGGSIVSAQLGLAWDKLGFDMAGVAQNFEEEVVQPIRHFTSQNLDVYIILAGLLDPFRSIGEILAGKLREHLYGNAELDDLPLHPEFVFNASNTQSGVLWRFSKTYMRDWQVGEVLHPKLELASAVAASAAFPPFVAPIRLPLKNADFTPKSGSDLQREPFTSDVVLMDGGVYDNLGLEAVLKRYDTVLVSDAGGRMEPDARPKLFWGFQAVRVMNMMDNQVRALRKRQLVQMYLLRNALLATGLDDSHRAVQVATRKGSYWSTFSNMDTYTTTNVLDCPYEKTHALARLSTRLWAMSKENQERLINWGYAICDAAMRKYVDSTLPANAKFPYGRGMN